MSYWLSRFDKWLLRRIADGLDREPEGFELDLHDVQAVEGYRAAVAAPPSIRTLKFFRLPDEGTTD